MSNIDISLSEQKAMEKLEKSLVNGELRSQFSPEAAYLDSSQQNHQSTTEKSTPKNTSKQDSGDSCAGLNFLKSFGDPAEVDDFAAFKATGLDLGTQEQISFSELLAGNAEWAGESSQYPALDALAAPTRPYYGDSPESQAGFFGVLRDNEAVQTTTNDGIFPEQLDSFSDFLQGQAVPEDQSFWNDLLNGPPLSEFDIDQACLQEGLTFQASDSHEIWNARPALDELTAAQASASLPSIESSQHVVRPPPLPLHSKPNLGPNGRLQQEHFHPRGQAAVASQPQEATSIPQPDDIRGWTPTEQSVEQDPKELAITPQRMSGKRKVAPLPLDDSSDEAFPISHLNKKQKIEECATKMAYVQGLVKHIEPGQTLNSRTTAIHHFNPSEVYDPVPNPPTLFSIFKYTLNGELEPGRLYTPSEIQDYLYSHPLHTLPSGVYDPKNGGLRLWIQRNPADSARRYPSPQSNRCRFTGCFATHNVINQGHIRVCFDEQTHLDLNTNPFHAAAYVHLNCLERFLDFPAICHDLPILPENRNLPLEPRGKNRMLLSPESSIHVAFKFIRASEAGTLTDYPSGGRPHEGTLVWRLMRNKVEEESHIFKRQQLARGGVKASQVCVHLGDLELESRVRDKTRRAKYQVRREEREEDEEEERVRVKRRYVRRGRA
ncbi:MAG: hypothetical protein Q9225_002679 [Loekoesia sp. 1 TL-2023]